MYLKEITIHGFKSFATKSDFAFTTAVTGIVGPNGSGKSNVAEAFRFVLGEQSALRMRSKKGEDLIFSGGARSSRQNRASVRVVFDNAQKTFPIDFDEVIIERVVNRDGSNEYSINGAKSRLKDVQELLASAHIGVTGHHIISQGEADRVLVASPKLRREMMEDALGLKVYQYKKIDSEKKLIKTRENSERVASLRRETKPHLQFLERQVKKYERGIALRTELADAYTDYLYREKTYLEYAEKGLVTLRKAPAQKLAELIRVRAEAQQSSQNIEAHPHEEELQRKQSSLHRLRSEYETAVRSSGSLEGQVGFLERRIAHLRAEHTKRAEVPTDTPIAYQDFSRAFASIESLTNQALASADGQVLARAIRDVLTVLSALKRQTTVQSAVPTLDLSHEEEELEILQEKKDAADTACRLLKEQQQVLQHDCSLLRHEIEAGAVEQRELAHRIEMFTHEIKEVEHEIRGLEDKHAELLRTHERFDAEVREAVVLVRSRAMQFMKYVAKDEQGNEIAPEVVAHTPREVQLERQRALERLKIRLEEMGGVNDEVLNEYKQAKERDEFLERELADLASSSEKLTQMIVDLTRELNEQFSRGVEKVDTEFNTFFEKMFNGGSAHLVRTVPKLRIREDSENDEEGSGSEECEGEEGVDIDIQLPNKRVRGLEMLSGGERALTSIALIFAMSQINPPPFIILDETDAALDEANSRRYGDMLAILAKKSQLILITHNRETMSRAGMLYGVTMGSDGVSRLLSIKLDEAQHYAK